METEDGPKAIEKLEIGDKVLAKSDITGEIGYKEVEKTFTRVADDVYTLTVGEEGDQVQVTGDHPFYVHDIGWVRTSNLQVGDELDTRWDGWALEVKDIKVEKKETRVYNLTVADFHTFFVSDLQIFTHNETCKIVYPSKPHTNKTPGHWEAMVDKAKELEQRDDIEKVYLNKGLGNEVELNGNPNRRPDVMAVRKDGKIDQYEVPSKTDKLKDLQDRMKDNQRIMGDRAGNTYILLPKP